MAPPGSHAFELRVPAVPASVGELRHALSAELETLPVPTALVEDIGLAVSEAATNAVLHAYLEAGPARGRCCCPRGSWTTSSTSSSATTAGA